MSLTRDLDSMPTSHRYPLFCPPQGDEVVLSMVLKPQGDEVVLSRVLKPQGDEVVLD